MTDPLDAVLDQGLRCECGRPIGDITQSVYTCECGQKWGVQVVPPSSPIERPDNTAFLQEYIDHQDINTTRTLTLPHGKWYITKPLVIRVNRPISEDDRFTVVSDIMGLNCDIVAEGLPSAFDYQIERPS